jgi:hypothetical protein
VLSTQINDRFRTFAWNVSISSLTSKEMVRFLSDVKNMIGGKYRRSDLVNFIKVSTGLREDHSSI